MSDGEAPSEIAYYYPEPYWLAQEGGWVKSLLLFFDEIAILLPSYMYGKHIVADPTLAGPIEDLGLLRVLRPETFVDEEMAARVTGVVEHLLDAGAFDALPESDSFAELSMSRMGFSTLRDLAEEVHHKLLVRGLAKESEDGLSVPLHPGLRSAYLVILAQLARETGQRHGLDLHPITNGRGAESSFLRLLELEPMPSRGHVVGFDLQTVGVDLDGIPLEEVLDFKRACGGAHRRYMQNLRRFTMELGAIESTDRGRALADRRAEIEEEARDLQRHSLQAWKSPKAVGGFSLGIAGAAWTLATANPVPAILGAIGAGLNMLPDKVEGSAYSYLFKAHKSLQ